MFLAFVFHQDPTTEKFVSRRHGGATDNLEAAKTMVEKTKQEGYVVRLGVKKPVWHNLPVNR